MAKEFHFEFIEWQIIKDYMYTLDTRIFISIVRLNYFTNYIKES